LGAETALDENNIERTSPLLSGPANDQSRYAAILYKEFIGNKATDYYLNEFVRLTRLESGRRSAPSVFSFIPSAHNYLARTWNTSSFIFSYAWALYRKLYGCSAALFLVSFVLFMAIREGSRSLGVIGLITASSAFGMYANALYYKKAKATINNARELSDSEEQTIAKVKDKGGVSDWALLAGVGHVLLGVPALLIALAAPQPSIDLASTSESASTSPADGRVYPVAPGKDHPASDSALATAVPDVVDSDRHIRDLYSARRFSELVQFAQQRLIEYPNDTLAANYAGLACVEMRNPVEARLWFQRAVELSPESPTLYYNLASTYNLQTDYRKIIEILTAAHQINPDNASVNDALISAQRFAQQIQAERAAQAPIRAIQPSPKTQAVDDYDCEVKPVMTDEEIRRWRKCSQ
jgi:tetratricopeptide (TPR) repeat protein